MLRTLTLPVTCIFMTPNLQAASSSDRQDANQARDSDMASTYVPLDSWVDPAFERLAAGGNVQTTFFSLRPWARLKEQTGWWQFPLLSTTGQRNAAFTIQLSYNRLGRAAKP
jgi:hypothetical protein